MFFGEIDAALNLWGRLRGWWQPRNNPPIETMVTRFVRLFESHGVHRNQIPRYFGHGLRLQDVKDDALLFACFSDDMLDAACAHFAVRREWLDGVDTQIHVCHDFYKKPEEFIEFINMLKKKNLDGELRGILLAPLERDWDASALLILEECVGFVGVKAVCRYHLCNNWIFPYWKARAYLAACVAIAWNQQVFITGERLPRKIIDEFADGTTLLGWQGEGIPYFGGARWCPEGMALKVEDFLEGVDPEEDNYGLRSGLALWLELEKKGLMNTGLGTTPCVQFQQKLGSHEK